AARAQAHQLDARLVRAARVQPLLDRALRLVRLELELLHLGRDRADPLPRAPQSGIPFGGRVRLLPGRLLRLRLQRWPRRRLQTAAALEMDRGHLVRLRLLDLPGDRDLAPGMALDLLHTGKGFLQRAARRRGWLDAVILEPAPHDVLDLLERM